MKHIFSLVLALVIVMLVVNIVSEGVVPDGAAVATRVEGTVRIVTRESPAGRLIRNNDSIGKNDRVEVQGNSRLELRLPDGGYLRLSDNARLTMRMLQFEKLTGTLYLAGVSRQWQIMGEDKKTRNARLLGGGDHPYRARRRKRHCLRCGCGGRREHYDQRVRRRCSGRERGEGSAPDRWPDKRARGGPAGQRPNLAAGFCFSAGGRIAAAGFRSEGYDQRLDPLEPAARRPGGTRVNNGRAGFIDGHQGELPAICRRCALSGQYRKRYHLVRNVEFVRCQRREDRPVRDRRGNRAGERPRSRPRSMI